MDPQATWVQLVEAYGLGDLETAADHAINLLEWLDRGGFPPETVSGFCLEPHLNRQVASAACYIVKKTVADETADH